MADPVMRPLTWDRRYHTYAEQHGFFDVIQDVLRELVIWKPEDPLMYMRDELSRISKSVYTPRVFFLGTTQLSKEIAENIAKHSGANYLTLQDIVDGCPDGLREPLDDYIRGKVPDENRIRKLLIAAMARRLAMPDCINNGYILYGFPQSRDQAMCAQMGGLLPRQVFVMLPESGTDELTQDHSGSYGYVATKGKSKSQMAIGDMKAHQDYFAMKATLAVFNPETNKVINYRRWMETKPSDLEAEFLEALITRKNRGGPWIPRVILIGLPGTGKTSIAEYIGVKFNIVHADWTDMVRGASLWSDEVGDDAKQYLKDLSPMDENSIKVILKRKLAREDCVKKGWVLTGFPETAAHARIMEELGMSGNRVFLLSSPDSICLERMSQKQISIMKRTFPSDFTTDPAFYSIKRAEDRDLNIGQNPYTEAAVNARLEYFNSNLKDVISYYGSFLIFVDATQSAGTVCDFVTASVLRPPNIRF